MRNGSWAAFMTKPAASRAMPSQAAPGDRLGAMPSSSRVLKGVKGPITHRPTKMKPAPNTLKIKYLKASRRDALSLSWAMARYSVHELMISQNRKKLSRYWLAAMPTRPPHMAVKAQ